MNSDQLYSIHEQGEGEEVVFEVESVAVTRLAETLSALANTHGGTVLLGIDPRGGIVRGVRAAEHVSDKTLAAALRCDPPLILPRPEITSLEEKTIVVAQVPAGLAHAYSVRGKYMARAGKKNVALGPRQLRQLLRERGETKFQSQPIVDATLDDLDDQLTQEYATAFLGGPPINKKQAVFDLLARRGCIVKDQATYRPTLSGLLLFGTDPQRFFPSAEILLARYPGKQMTDEFQRDTALGPLTEQLKRAQVFILSNMRKGSRIDGMQRSDKSEYPLPVVREAIVNAVAHRDYGIRGDEIRVLMFSDRIEVYSPGRLPGHMTVDNIVEERFSRNEIIVQVLADLGFVERLGYGIDRMIQLMKECGLPAPRFAETANGFRVILLGPGDKWESEEPERGKWQSAVLNERQRRALEYLSQNARITNREYHELFPDVSEETLRRDLAGLVEEGLLLKMGDKKGTYYILK